MSIAVMNSVWASSPTSGNERLVLLALADACSRDDGTGCWPSAATIARKANISARSVRRVIARLEAAGHLRVHRGGGRAGSTNSYTVVMATHDPGQNVTPDKMSGRDNSDTPPLTRPCQGTPDTAASADPPVNHQGTTAPHASGARTCQPVTAGGEAQAAEFFNRMAGISPRWLLTASQRGRLSPAVASALAAGWTPGALADHVGANTARIRNPAAVLAARLSQPELPQPPPRAASWPPWCGECHEQTRRRESADGADAGRCPDCHPLADRGQSTRRRPDRELSPGARRQQTGATGAASGPGPAGSRAYAATLAIVNRPGTLS
jgi:hypothetical protein